jgi:hypothetical protein
MCESSRCREEAGWVDAALARKTDQAARAFVVHRGSDDVQRIIEGGHELLEG